MSTGVRKFSDYTQEDVKMRLVDVLLRWSARHGDVTVGMQPTNALTINQTKSFGFKSCENVGWF